MPRRPDPDRRLSFPSLCGLAVLCLALLGYWAFRHIDQDMHRDLERDTTQIARSVPLDLLASLASHTALPATALLIAFVPLASLMASLRRPTPPQKPTLRRLLPPLVAIQVLMAALAGSLFWQLEKGHLDEMVRDRLLKIPDDLRASLAKETTALTMTLQPIAANLESKKALAAKDGDRLRSIWRPVFDQLHRDNGISHFCFLDPDRICLLRLHDPDRHGDRIERFTASEAESTRLTAAGLELGDPGTFTLRAVQPVRHNGSLIGYVELGKGIEDIFTGLTDRSGIELSVLLNKNRLDREHWEADVGRLARPAAWDRYPEQVMIYSSSPLTDDFALLSPHARGGRQRHGDLIPLTSDGRPWRLAIFPLDDASGTEVGDLVARLDISSMQAASGQRVILLLSAEGLLLALLVPLVVVLLSRTDRSIALQRLNFEESEERLRSITEAARDAIILMDPQGRISYWNPAAETIFGFSREEAIGQDTHRLLAPEHYQARFHQAFPEFQHSGQGPVVGTTVEVAARRKDGQEITVELFLAAIQLKGDWHALAVLRDVSERKRAEAALRQANQQLATASQQATALAARAEAANLAKSEFLANMSHEIRTPMNGVIGMAELLLTTELAPTQRRYAEIVRASGATLLELINNILDISKIEAGKLELAQTDFDLLSLLDDITTAMALLAHDKGLELFCRVEAEVPALLWGDPGRLRQIIVNLVGNAIKFTRQGAITIQVSRLAASEDTVHLRFAVHDTGIGIAPDKIEFIFKKFTQVDTSATRQYGGTGLGLAIARQVVEAMGGEMGVTSEPGQGSEFWFSLQLARQTGQLAMPRAQLADQREVPLLVVSGNAMQRDILCQRLATWGLRPGAAANGATALALLAEAVDRGCPFRLALVDMMLPDMDGESLGRTIKADQRLADTILVLLTSFGMRGDASRFQGLGFAAYLTKPILHLELVSLLATLLGRAAGGPADSPTSSPGQEEGPILTRHAIRDQQRQAASGATRLLVVEDNLINQQVTQELLTHLGLESDVVENGQEALSVLATIPYALVLMDIMMPVMDGLVATARIRDPQSAVVNHQIPIIAMTANAMPSDRDQALGAGMNDYLSKPIELSRLREVIERWLPPPSSRPAREAAIVPAPAAPTEGDALPPVFDRQAMMLLLMHNEDMARRLVAIFPQSATSNLEQLKSALSRQDGKTATRQAHSLKGTAAQMGGEAVRRVAAAMEADGKAGDLEAMRARLPELEARLAELLTALKAASF